MPNTRSQAAWQGAEANFDVNINLRKQWRRASGDLVDLDPAWIAANPGIPPAMVFNTVTIDLSHDVSSIFSRIGFSGSNAIQASATATIGRHEPEQIPPLAVPLQALTTSAGAIDESGWCNADILFTKQGGHNPVGCFSPGSTPPLMSGSCVNIPEFNYEPAASTVSSSTASCNRNNPRHIEGGEINPDRHYAVVGGPVDAAPRPSLR